MRTMTVHLVDNHYMVVDRRNWLLTQQWLEAQLRQELREAEEEEAEEASSSEVEEKD